MTSGTNSSWQTFLRAEVAPLYDVSLTETEILVTKFPDENTIIPNREVADLSTKNDKLPCSTETVDRHLRTIYMKLGEPKKPNCERFPGYNTKRGQSRDPELLAWLKPKYCNWLKSQRTAIVMSDRAADRNPFIPLNGRVEDPQLFFNRQQEIRRVFEVLNSGSSVALIGDEGIGKSSMLWMICQQAKNCLQLPRKPVYIDLNGVCDEDDFYSALCEEVGIPTSHGNTLTRALRSHKVLLALDNAGKMTWEGFTREIRANLRGLAEGSNASLKLILAASQPLNELFNDSQDEGKTSPLAGICQEENIKPWDEATSRAFIEARLAITSVRFTEEEIIQVWQASSGHTRKLMLLCNQIYARYAEKIQ